MSEIPAFLSKKLSCLTNVKMIKDLAYECAKHFAEVAVEVVLVINGHSIRSKSKSNLSKFLREVPVFMIYEIYFRKAVLIALYNFSSEINMLTSMIWKDIMATEESKRKNEFFRKILQAVPGYYRIFPERFFVFMAAIGELCANCYACEMMHLVPMALLAAQCFLTRILQRVPPLAESLNVHTHITKFLEAYDNPIVDKELEVSLSKFTGTRI